MSSWPQRPAPRVAVPTGAMFTACRGFQSLEAQERATARVSERVTVHDLQNDPMSPRIARAVAATLADGKVVAPVDVLVKMDVLALKDERSVLPPTISTTVTYDAAG